MKAIPNIERCKACGLCILNCGKGALALSEELNKAGYKVIAVDEEKCVGCGICYTVCPDGVFSIVK